MELQHVLIRLQFHLQGFYKSGVPSNELGRIGACWFHYGYCRGKIIDCLLPSQIDGYFKKGMAEGMAKNTLEIARKMKAMGFSDEQIQTATGLPVETIKQL